MKRHERNTSTKNNMNTQKSTWKQSRYIDLSCRVLKRAHTTMLYFVNLQYALQCVTVSRMKDAVCDCTLVCSTHALKAAASWKRVGNSRTTLHAWLTWAVPETKTWLIKMHWVSARKHVAFVIRLFGNCHTTAVKMNLCMLHPRVKRSGKLKTSRKLAHSFARVADLSGTWNKTIFENTCKSWRRVSFAIEIVIQVQRYQKFENFKHEKLSLNKTNALRNAVSWTLP